MQKICIWGEYLYVSHTLYFILREIILYLEKNYTLFGNLAVATLYRGIHTKDLKVPYHRRGCTKSFYLNFKSQYFSRPLLERSYMHEFISIENISFSRNCDIKITNAKSITNASIWVMFISTNSDMLEIVEHSRFKISYYHLPLWISFQVN